jgi:3-deoxy-D-manno-octulosonic-acid transferase
LARLAAAGFSGRRLSDLLATDSVEAASWRCIVVDSVGALAEIYRASRLAYVGGGFGRGVHNVLEPAICAQPVLMGPRHANAAEAMALIEADAARALRDASAVESALAAWLDDAQAGSAAGARGREFVLAQRGATERSLALLNPYLSR